jgi:RNA polymerase sigma-70 factor (ECF subfamily)
MVTSAATTPELLLLRAKAGDTDAWGSLLEFYQPYLRLVARSIVRKHVHFQIDLSDVVQETNLKACRALSQFQGSDEPELVAWLRQILTNLVLNQLKKQERPGRRPESLDALLERASQEAHWALAAPGSTPSAGASRREQAVLTANALESLPADYQQVLVMHYLEKVPHKEIGQRMGRSESASRMLLMRAARELEKQLREQP